MTATPAPAPTDAEQEVVARFGIFEPEEREAALVETVVDALHSVKWPDGEPKLRMARVHVRALAAAAITAYRAAQDGGAEEAVRRVEALTEELGFLVDDETVDEVARVSHAWTLHRIRAALATQARDGAR